MIIKFDYFVNEVRFSDNTKLIGDNTDDIFNKIKKEIDTDFNVERDLIKYITIKKRINGDKIRFEIDYNDNIKHNLKKRIDDRTSFKSIKEFNDLIEIMLNYLFPDKLNDLTVVGKYAVYFEEYKKNIIFSFNYKEYLKKIYYIKIITILPNNFAIDIIKNFFIT